MNKPLILVVEDDTPVRNLMVTALKTNDYRYLVAPDGRSAVMEASSHNPDMEIENGHKNKTFTDYKPKRRRP